VLWYCLLVLVIFGDLFLAVKAEERLPAFVSLSTFCLAGETEIGNAADMFIAYLFFAIIAEVRYITDMPRSNLFFALWAESRYATDVTISDFFFAIVAKEG